MEHISTITARVMRELEWRRKVREYQPKEGDVIRDLVRHRVIHVDAVETDLVAVRICDLQGGLLEAVRVGKQQMIDQIAERDPGEIEVNP